MGKVGLNIYLRKKEVGRKNDCKKYTQNSDIGDRNPFHANIYLCHITYYAYYMHNINDILLLTYPLSPP